MKIIRYLSLASLLISGFATAMQNVSEIIEISNQSDKVAFVWNWNGEKYLRSTLMPYQDEQFLEGNAFIYTSQGEYQLSIYKNTARLDHFITGNQNNKWELKDITERKDLKPGEKALTIINPNGTVSLTSR